MATINNVWQKATKFAATALGLLRSEVKLPGIFTVKMGVADFRGAAGDVVGIKRPPLLRARDKGWRNNNAIVVDSLEQSKIQVALDKHPYSAVALTAEETTLDEVDYAANVQMPQITALVDWWDEAIASCLSGAPYVLGVTFNPDSADAKLSDPRKVASRARKLFQDAKVPMSGRYWLVGSSVAESIRDNDKLLDVAVSGIPEALRDGVVTKLSGFTVVEIDALDENESYFVHETAVALVTVAPAVPQGVTKGGSTAAEGGLAVTQLWDYDSDYLQDRSIVHAFAGASVVQDPEVGADGRIVMDGDAPRLQFVRGIKVTFGAGGSEKASWSVAVTGSPTGGTFTLTVDGETTEAIAYNAANADIADALNALDGVAGVKVTGTTTKTVVFKERVALSGSGAGLTGGTTPAVSVS